MREHGMVSIMQILSRSSQQPQTTMAANDSLEVIRKLKVVRRFILSERENEQFVKHETHCQQQTKIQKALF